MKELHKWHSTCLKVKKYFERFLHIFLKYSSHYQSILKHNISSNYLRHFWEEHANYSKQKIAIAFYTLFANFKSKMRRFVSRMPLVFIQCYFVTMHSKLIFIIAVKIFIFAWKIFLFARKIFIFACKVFKPAVTIINPSGKEGFSENHLLWRSCS